MQALAPSAWWGVIFKTGAGAIAFLGFCAVSQASLLTLSPTNALMGLPYSGVINCATPWPVQSATCNSNCLSGGSFVTNGLTVAYDGASSITINGTPTSTNIINFAAKVYNGFGCGGSLSFSQTVTLHVYDPNGPPIRPFSVAAPQHQISLVGTPATLSGGAFFGYPPPYYQWWKGLAPLTGQTNSVLNIASVAITDAGVYFMTASNAADVGETILTLPSATCYLSACIVGGTNSNLTGHTNFVPADVALTISSFVTNSASITNNYTWYYNGVGVPIGTSNTFSFTAAQVVPSRSGIYSVLFTNSFINSSGMYVGQIIPGQTNSFAFYVPGAEFDTYWDFGYLPMFTNTLPASTNVNIGSNVMFSIAVGGSLNVNNPFGGFAAGSYVTNTVTPCVFWYQNGNLVAAQNYVCGPTSNTTYSNSVVHANLTLNGVTLSNSGNYTVVATNYWGSITSSPVSLIVSGANLGNLTTMYDGSSNFILQLTNLTGQGAIVISSSTNLTQWVPIFTNPAGFGPFSFTDVTANQFPHRFYRATSP